MSPDPLERTALAPAKVNLGLRIVGRRDDGYHQIESLFAPLDLADRLRIRAEASDETTVSLRLKGATPDVPPDGRNLAVRAVTGFLAEAGVSASVEIELEKEIPSGAGLGGGSSDAGTALRLLADFWPGALPPDALSGLARSLGADVPFFLDPRPAWVSGVGERIVPLAGVPSLSLLLVNPGTRLATAEVYQAFDALQGSGAPPPPLPAPDTPWDEAPLRLRLRNDLERAAIRLCPAVRRLRETLAEAGALATTVSGSGPTLLGVFATADGARTAAESFGPKVWTRVASTCESR